VLAVSPNNPTGSTLTGPERDGLARRCGERGAALIVDEVFADYPLTSGAVPAPAPSIVNPPAPCLTFLLGGLSKSAGLPQVKLGWIGVDGPADLVRAALARLEFICDTYLSVATPVQVAAPRLIEDGAIVRTRILERVRSNHESLRVLTVGFPSVGMLHGDAGWSAVLRVPSTRSEEELALELLEQDGVLVHPGFFFDFAHEAFLVTSLLPERPTFVEAVRRVLERVAV
jgi:aspartate/methionine/tyrosine aminotransferase